MKTQLVSVNINNSLPKIMCVTRIKKKRLTKLRLQQTDAGWKNKQTNKQKTGTVVQLDPFVPKSINASREVTVT